MHEMGIAISILGTVRAETRRFPNRRILKVGVRIGELAGVDPEAMSFCFEVLVRGTEWEPLSLDIERCPRRYQCRACGLPRAASGGDSACPQCGAQELRFAGGDELDIAYLEVEDGTSAAGA